MADRAHIRSGIVISKYNSEKGWITLENGQKASPVIIGFVDGNDMVVPIVDELVDNSTGPDTITEVTVPWVIQTTPDRYYRQRTVRDKTAQENTDEAASVKNNLNLLFDNQPEIKSLFDLCWRIARANVPASALVRKSEFRKWFKDNLL